MTSWTCYCCYAGNVSGICQLHDRMLAPTYIYRACMHCDLCSMMDKAHDVSSMGLRLSADSGHTVRDAACGSCRKL